MKLYLKQKVFSFKDQFYVRDINGNEVYQVVGKMFSLQNEFDLKTIDGEQRLKAKRKVFSLLGKYTLTDVEDRVVAQVNRKFGFRPKFEILLGHETLHMEGSIFGYNFTIERNGSPIATIQKQVLTWGDTYEIDIIDESQLEVYLFIVVIIDQMLHESKNNGFNS